MIGFTLGDLDTVSREEGIHFDHPGSPHPLNEYLQSTYRK